jgi:hypothetical protein
MEIEKAHDLSAILDASHENKWVAINLSYSRVLAAADTLRDLIPLVKDPDAIYYRVLPRHVTFAPTIYRQVTTTTRPRSLVLGFRWPSRS